MPLCGVGQLLDYTRDLGVKQLNRIVPTQSMGTRRSGFLHPSLPRSALERLPVPLCGVGQLLDYTRDLGVKQ